MVDPNDMKKRLKRFVELEGENFGREKESTRVSIWSRYRVVLWNRENSYRSDEVLC